MNLRLTMGSILVLGLLLITMAQAAPPTKVRIEINFLLSYVEGSGCEFNRNGTWYDAKAARVHLSDKYNFLAALNRINTTEDFIEKVATKSTFSDHPYEVRCPGRPTVSSYRWLHEELARFRVLP